MDLKPDFSFRPLPEIADPIHLPFPKLLNPLGPLASLPGRWSGKGFNTIWRPFNKPGQDRFLELNLTAEDIEFTAISGEIPNRGLLQPDINMFGITYLQQIKDANVGAGLHIEPGIWAVVPATTNPAEPPTVVRMASIPHGTTILAQGISPSPFAGGPQIAPVNILPFPVGQPNKPIHFPEMDLSKPTPFRSPPPQLVGITQAMVDNPNSVLSTAIQGQTITHTTVLEITTTAKPVLGGGTSNTAFLKGGPAGPNADAVEVRAIFWIETVQGAKGQPSFLQLQYTQTVMLNFNGVTWPHVTVATLRKKVPVTVPIQWIDPKIPLDLLARLQSKPVGPDDR